MMDSTLSVLTPYGHDPNAYQASFYISVRCRWLQVYMSGPAMDRTALTYGAYSLTLHCQLYRV